MEFVDSRIEMSTEMKNALDELQKRRRFEAALAYAQALILGGSNFTLEGVNIEVIRAADDLLARLTEGENDGKR